MQTGTCAFLSRKSPACCLGGIPELGRGVAFDVETDRKPLASLASGLGTTFPRCPDRLGKDHVSTLWLR